MTNVIANNPQVFTSSKKDWCTPSNVLDVVTAVAPIGLDPCSNEHSIVPANHKIALSEDGLAVYWNGYGLVYVNPPYGDEAYEFIQKAAEGEGDSVIMLLPARVGTKWWRTWIWPTFDALCFWHGRIRFLGQDAHGNPVKTGAPFDSAFVYWGDDWDKFVRAFEPHGYVLVNTQEQCSGEPL